MTETQASTQLPSRPPTLLRPALRFTDAADKKWVVEHRVLPWRRLIQPFNLTFRGFRRYITADMTKALAERHQNQLDQEKWGAPWDDWPRRIQLLIMPVAAVSMIVCWAGFWLLQILELLLRLAAALVLCVPLVVEFLSQALVAVVRRQTGRPACIEVICEDPDFPQVGLMTMVVFADDNLARTSAQTLAEHLAHRDVARLSQDPGAAHVIATFGGRITKETPVRISRIRDWFVYRNDKWGFLDVVPV